MSDKSYTPGTISDKLTPDIDFTDRLVVQNNVPVVKNSFVDDWKEIIQMIRDTKYYK